MKKEEILNGISDEAQRKNVETVLNFVEETAKSGLTKEAVTEEITETMKNLKIEAKTVEGLESFIETKITDLSKAVKDLQEKGTNEALSIQEKFSKELNKALDEKKSEIEAAAKGGSVARIVLKTAATIIGTSNFGTGVVMGFRESQVDGTLPNEFEPISLISRMNGGPGSNPLTWVERSKLNGGAAGVAEGDSKPYMDTQWVEGAVNSITIAVVSAISKKAINNYPTLENEIRQELFINLRNELNRQIISGTGTGLAADTELKGLLSYATAFNAGGETVAAPNKWDVLLFAWKQSRKAYKGSRPNAILVSIGGGVDLDLEKDEFGRYIMPDFMINRDKTLKGVPIIEADDITDGQYLIGDFTKCLFNMVQDVTIDIGFINEQFLKNQFCIRAELEGMQRVKSQYAGSFIKGTFATDIETIRASQN